MKKEVYAIKTDNCNVSFSSTHPNKDGKNFSLLYPLDSIDSWHAATHDKNQWIQISTGKPKRWISVITQGRPNNIQWISKYKVSHSKDGQIWSWADDGKVYQGNNDGNTKIKNDFKEPFYASRIKIHPVQWNKSYPCIVGRFDAIYQEE